MPKARYRAPVTFSVGIGILAMLALFWISPSLAGWRNTTSPETSLTLYQATIGKVWHVTEDGGWTATWTRRGNSLVFDGSWTRGGQPVTGVLTMSVQGNTVRIQSRQQSNGYDVDYEGTLSQDGRSIRGTLRIIGGGQQNWSATIDGASAAVSPPPQPPPPPLKSGTDYSVINYSGNVKNPHDFRIDFDSCKVSEYNEEYAQGTETITVSLCQPRSRLKIRTELKTGYWIEYDWVFIDNATIVGGLYRDAGGVGPSVGKAKN